MPNYLTCEARFQVDWSFPTSPDYAFHSFVRLHFPKLRGAARRASSVCSCLGLHFRFSKGRARVEGNFVISKVGLGVMGISGVWPGPISFDMIMLLA